MNGISPDLLLHGGLVLTPQGLVVGDIAIVSGRIAAVTKPGYIGGAVETLDVGGLVVLPGAIDAHVHFDEPGRNGWEGWSTGSLAAAAGGVTTVVDMPIDSDPPTTTAAALVEKRFAAGRSSLVDFALWGGLIEPDPNRLAALADVGAAGFKAFLCESGWKDFPAVDDTTLKVGCELAASRGLCVAVHCEAGELLQAHGPLGLARPVAAEVAAVRKAAEIAASTGAALHVVHASSAEGVLEAKRWPGVSVETCPHYLVLDDGDVERIGTAAWCAPPIRDSANRERLVQLVDAGAIDTVASDHSPCPPELKAGPDPFLGVIGVETTLSVLWSMGRFDLETISKLRTAAAALLGLPAKGAIATGFDADLCLFDPDSTWTPAETSLHSRHRHSPFGGTALRGSVVTTIVRGRVVYANNEPVGVPTGRFLRPSLARPPVGRR